MGVMFMVSWDGWKDWTQQTRVEKIRYVNTANTHSLTFKTDKKFMVVVEEGRVAKDSNQVHTYTL